MNEPRRMEQRPARSPDLDELETLVACAAEGSMAGAAVRLGISRPAVAKRIRNLERMVGRPLLQRSGRGVSLTDAGATVLAGARRLLDERESLMQALKRIRSDGALGNDGIHRLLGPTSPLARAALQPEARLIEAEQLLELVLGSTSTGIAISDAEHVEVHVVNDAFCRFVGRSREELMSGAAAYQEMWDDEGERAEIVARVRRDGSAEGMNIRVRQPDGSVRFGTVSARFITLAGAPKMLWCVEDLSRPGARANVDVAPGPATLDGNAPIASSETATLDGNAPIASSETGALS